MQFSSIIVPYTGTVPDISKLYGAPVAIGVNLYFSVPQQMSLETAVNNQIVSAERKQDLSTLYVKPVKLNNRYQAIEVALKPTRQDKVFPQDNLIEFFFINDLGGTRYLQGLRLQSKTENDLRNAENDFRQIASTIKLSK